MCSSTYRLLIIGVCQLWCMSLCNLSLGEVAGAKNKLSKRKLCNNKELNLDTIFIILFFPISSRILQMVSIL